MSIRMYRKKPVVIEALEYTGYNLEDIKKWNDEIYESAANVDGEFVKQLFIPTLEGEMTAQLGDFIIKGVQGECYPCKPDIFEQTYEQVFE